MAGIRAPTQWSLSKQETITSFEAWRQNLQYTLSLDPNFAPFLIDGVQWSKKTSTAPLRGFESDNEDVPEAKRRTAEQKVTQLELLLGQIANYCPIISRNSIVKSSTSTISIWQAIRSHFGFQSTGAHFLDFNSIRLGPGERPEDLYQRLLSFVDDNLLKANGGIRHHGDHVTSDEEVSPTTENIIVVTWLRLIHPSLPALVKQRYGTELRSQTVASLKPEISQALDTLLDEVNSSDDAKVLRTAFKQSSRNTRPPPGRNQQSEVPKPTKGASARSCPLCKQANRQYYHYLSKCPFLPDDDRQYLSRSRQVLSEESEHTTDRPSSDPEPEDPETGRYYRIKTTTHHVNTKSPILRAFYDHHPLHLTLDTGAETSMIKTSVAKAIGATIQNTKQKALQADGITQLAVVGTIHLSLTRNHLNLQLDALVVDNLDVDVLGGTPFMAANDISVRPSRQQVTIQGTDTAYYGTAPSGVATSNVRRTEATVLRASSTSSVVWPGSYLELDIPQEFDPDVTLAIEPRLDGSKAPGDWLSPHIIEAVSGTIRILNDTDEPKTIPRHDHFCQVLLTAIPELNDHNPPLPIDSLPSPLATQQEHSSAVQLDPDSIIPEKMCTEFRSLLKAHDDVSDTEISGYHGAAGPFEAVVNMGPAQPLQRKRRLPQCAHNKLVELQQKFDDLESQGVFQRPEEAGITVEYLNPLFLVKKRKEGGHRLVTAVADVGRYSKPQPPLVPDVDSILRTIAKWKYIIVSDLTSAFYQIPLAKASMKYCGVATPFCGVRVYTRCAMGIG